MKSLGINPLLLPVVFAQGWWVRRITPRLPDAAGPAEGVVKGSSPAFRLILLGESTVAGIGAPNHEQALSGHTARALASRTGRAVQWTAIGKSGAEARVVRDELAPQLAGRSADAVVIALGVNDSTGLTSPTQWKDDTRELIEAIRARISGVKIVLAAPPPLQDFPAFPKLLQDFLGARARMLGQGLAELAPTLNDVVYEPMLEGLNEEHFCDDKFHPSVRGYALWGEHLSKYLY